MKRIALLLLALAVARPGLAQDIKGQRPFVMIGDAFLMAPGSWATYTIHDKASDEFTRITFAALERTRRQDKECLWFEIEALTAAGETVVTRVLIEDPRKNSSNVLEAVVWVYGFKPFKVPEKYIRGDDRNVGQFALASVLRRLEPRSITFDGRPLTIVEVEASDKTGSATTAAISEALPPLGLLFADSKDAALYLETWGTGATTRITEEPVGFTTWILETIQRAIGGEDVGMTVRKPEPIDATGTWLEADGRCPGSRWTLGGGTGPGTLLQVESHCGDGVPLSLTGRAVRWKTPRVLTAELGDDAAAGRATVVLLTDIRALVAFVDATGRVTLGNLQRSTR